MRLTNVFGVSASALAMALASAPAVYAQQTTSDVRGVVTDSAGAPVAGASVTITDELTGTTRTTTTDGSGRFSGSNLNVSGLYSVTATSSGFAPASVQGVRLSLGDVTAINLTLSDGAVSDEIVVVATRSAAVEVATGPSATFNFSDLQNTPAISRDIKDVIRTDPRLFIDPSDNNDALQCGGASPRFNSLTVDGIRLNDNFGLNGNGYPTERLPFSIDAIDQVAVELSPFDVEYGGFTGCAINAVTRSGTNEFHGSGFIDYTDDGLRGGSIEGDSFDKGDFKNTRFGATLSGPVIKDRLFFFASYEKNNNTEVGALQRGPAEAGAIGAQGVSQAQLDRIAQIARDVYGYDVVPLPATFGEDDEKILVKLDWNVNDNHRASFTYNFNEGNNITPSDDDADEYEFFDHYYLRGTKISSYSGQIFSNWTDAFSTEVRISYTTNDTSQRSTFGNDFGEVRIRTGNNGETADVYLGGDDSRQSNALQTDTLNMKFLANYNVGNHSITGGFERETVDIFNLFIQHSQGEYRFDSFGSSDLAINPDANIDAFEAGLFDDLFYGNAGGTNNPDDGAASFKFSTNSVYLQDKYSIDDYGLTITAGLRYDFYTSSDTPRENPNFVSRNGFANTNTFDGEGLLQPRLAVNWDATDTLAVRAGVGIFGGGNPNVWLSNSYQNDGITTIQTGLRDGDFADLTFINDEGGNTPGRPIFGVPQSLFNEVASGTADTGVNFVDPDFDIPSQWKVSGGLTWNFSVPGLGDDFVLVSDYIFTKDRDAAHVTSASLASVGTTLTGVPLLRVVDFSDPDCATAPGDEVACTGRSSNPFSQDLVLTNTEGGRAHIFSAALSKQYEFDGGWDFDWTLGYAFINAQDRSPMASSVAGSNYSNYATLDPRFPARATSNYEVPHRITLQAGLRKAFFGDNLTKMNLFGVISQSRPFSIVYENSGSVFGDGVFDGRAPIYVPTGIDDPNVMFDPGFDTAAFFQTLENLNLTQYAGQHAPRNAFQSDWFSQWDLRIEQEFPGFFDGHKAAAFVIIDNIGNLINDEWGVVNQASFPGIVELVELGGVTDSGQLIYSGFSERTRDSIQAPIVDASVWEIRFGIRYEF